MAHEAQHRHEPQPQIVVPSWLAKLLCGVLLTVILSASAWAFNVSLSLERVSTEIRGLHHRLERIEKRQ